MDRRRFIQSGLAGTAALGVAGSGLGLLSSCAEPKKKSPSTELRLSFQEYTAPGDSLNERLDFMEAHGIVGLEPGGSGLASRVAELQDALRGRKIGISAICAGFDGFILSEDANVLSLIHI